MDVKELDFFKKQIESYIDKAYGGGVGISMFLDETKQAIINNMNTKGIDVLFDGGFDDAEYKRAIFLPLGYSADFKIKVYEIIYNHKYFDFNHRNVLGSLMSLGIKRESIGDIIFVDKKIYFACTEEINAYILNEFKMVSHASIELKEVKDRIKVIRNIVEETVIVSSMRLDVIIATAYNMSRNDSNEFINGGLVNVNHIECLNNSKLIKENDVISVRHKGRIYVNEIIRKTKSDRLAIKIGFLK